MTVAKLEILERRPYADGRIFGRVGAYERIDAIAYYSVDPTEDANREITDLDLVTPDADGRVHFFGDFTLLQPADLDAGNRALLVQVPNRGRRMITHINIGDVPITSGPNIDPGDGFVFEEGWTVAWAGWQWDVPREEEPFRAGLCAPQVPLQKRGSQDKMQLRLQVNEDKTHLPLTDQHVGDFGRHRAIPPLDPQDPRATLWVRDNIYDQPECVDRRDWQFARMEKSKVIVDKDYVWLRGGFQAGRIYDLFYQPHECPVVGAGLLAIRDMASWLRYDPAAPTADRIDHVIGEGLSQTGRFWRTFVYLGLNRNEDKKPAVDGILSHIAGAKRGEFNQRYGQPSVQPTPSIGHLFPFADDDQDDPLTGMFDGLLNRQRALGCLPRIIYTNSSAEYWRGDAALAHTDMIDGDDAEPPQNVRHYLFSGTQHSSGQPVLTYTSAQGSKGSNYLNMIDYRPLYRACLVNLLAWVSRDQEPPASQFPRKADGTRLSRRKALEQLSEIPGFNLPDETAMPVMRPLDLGADAKKGNPRLPAILGLHKYPDWVSALDMDGNEIGGIAMPDIRCPIATHSGFNPRHPQTGGAGQILEYYGSTVPFPRDTIEKSSKADSRPAISDRYKDKDDYLTQVRAAVEELVISGYVLARDIDLCCDNAVRRYDAVCRRESQHT